MVSIKTNIRPEEVRHKSQHVLFVEGSDIDSVDPTVLSELFNNILTVKPLGASFHIKSAAEALYTHHPTYYFLIDRDHHDEKIVDEYWSTFPDPEKCNLLIWRRREIENYFLDPEYLGRSEYCRVDQGTLEKKILEYAQERLFLDAANYVVVSIREELKSTGINVFGNPEEFSSRTDALAKLKK